MGGASAYASSGIVYLGIRALMPAFLGVGVVASAG